MRQRRSSEDAELADVLDKLNNPDAVTLAQIKRAASDDFEQWLTERKNWPSLPHRMERCGYVPFRNDGADDGLWKFDGKRQVIYVKTTLSSSERELATRSLRG